MKRNLYPDLILFSEVPMGPHLPFIIGRCVIDELCNIDIGNLNLNQKKK